MNRRIKTTLADSLCASLLVALSLAALTFAQTQRTVDAGPRASS